MSKSIKRKSAAMRHIRNIIPQIFVLSCLLGKQELVKTQQISTLPIIKST